MFGDVFKPLADEEQTRLEALEAEAEERNTRLTHRTMDLDVPDSGLWQQMEDQRDQHEYEMLRWKSRMHFLFHGA